MVLPNLYFRVMLYTDQVTSKQVVEKVGVKQMVNRPAWVKTYKDTSWFEEMKRRKMMKQRTYKKQWRRKIVKHDGKYYKWTGTGGRVRSSCR